jgi:hypothetical protein
MRTLLVCIPLVIPLTADGAVLIEIQATATSQRSAAGEPVHLAFVTETDADGQTQLGGMFGPSDVGMSFDATPDALVRMERALTTTFGRYWLDSQTGATPAGGLADTIWTIDVSYWIEARHVPRLGVGLTGYDLTRVSHTIDSINYHTVSGAQGIFSTHTHTVRLYGVAVPEPSCWLLALHYVLGICCARRQRM